MDVDRVAAEAHALKAYHAIKRRYPKAARVFEELVSKSEGGMKDVELWNLWDDMVAHAPHDGALVALNKHMADIVRRARSPTREDAVIHMMKHKSAGDVSADSGEDADEDESLRKVGKLVFHRLPQTGHADDSILDAYLRGWQHTAHALDAQRVYMHRVTVTLSVSTMSHVPRESSFTFRTVQNCDSFTMGDSTTRRDSTTVVRAIAAINHIQVDDYHSMLKDVLGARGEDWMSSIRDPLQRFGGHSVIERLVIDTFASGPSSVACGEAGTEVDYDLVKMSSAYSRGGTSNSESTKVNFLGP